MKSLEEQIGELFETAADEIKELVTAALKIEKEFLHLERPHGVMEKIIDALDNIAQASLKKEEQS